MYVSNDPQLSGLLSKVRKAIHKVIPRELSPTRMLEKMQKDKQEKAALKLEAEETARAAANKVAEAETAAQVAILQANALPSQPTQTFPLVENSFGPANPATMLPTSAPATASDNTAIYVGLGALGVLGAVLLLTRKGSRK